MSAALAAAGARMRHVGVRRRRSGHPCFGPGYWVILSDLAVAVPALDWRARTNLEYCIAGGFARFHFCRGSEPRLRFCRLPAGALFRQDLEGVGVSHEIADPFSRFYLPAVRAMCLL